MSAAASDQPAPDVFAAVLAMLTLVTDAPACKKRLAELHAATEALAKREAKLAADRAAFEAERVKVLAELGRERQAISRRLEMVLDPQSRDYLRHRVENPHQTVEA